MRCCSYFLLFVIAAHAEAQGLKDHYRDFFPIGVSVGPDDLKGEPGDFILTHFNSLTAENAMKMGPIHPEENRYRWEPADAIAEFAGSHKMKLRGHTLCWHNQTPSWLFTGPDGKKVSKELLLDRLKQHIFSVVGRYKGKVYAWDVVNEAIDDRTDVFYRPSPWYEICGEEFIALAFRYAHEADPDALLFYNDYNTEDAVKREKIIRLVTSLQKQQVPIHGVGLQGHWSIYGPEESAIRESLRQFSALGLRLQITELDISVYVPEPKLRERRPDEKSDFTSDMEERQRSFYGMAFRLFREFRGQLTGVTFWNVSDRHSWLDNFPVRGRKNYPLLFDSSFKPKKAYEEVIQIH